MSKLADLEKLIKLNGDEDKYNEGLKILNSSGIGGNSGFISLIIGVAFVVAGITLNPGLQQQFKNLFLKDAAPKIDSVEPIPEPSPPLPPEIQQNSPPLPPSPLPVQQPIRSLGYIKP